MIAFTSNSMEIRLIVNGNLVHTMTMPQLQLVASKNDIFFATTAPEFFPNRSDRLFVDSRQHEQQKHTPPSSPNGKSSIILMMTSQHQILNCVLDFGYVNVNN